MYKLTRDKFLTLEEQKLLNTRKCSSRDKLLLELSLATGARASEVLNITTNDINHENKSVYIRGLKNSNDREIPLHNATYMLLWEYIAGRTGRVFNIKYRQFENIWRMYRPANKKLHSLRHTFAVNLYKKTKDIKLVQMALGHRNIANTMVYVDFVYTQDELRKLIL